MSKLWKCSALVLGSLTFAPTDWIDGQRELFAKDSANQTTNQLVVAKKGHRHHKHRRHRKGTRHATAAAHTLQFPLNRDVA